MEFDCIQNSGRFFSALVRDLKSLATSNIQYFQDGKQSYHAKFHMSFCLLYDYLDMGIEPSFRELSSHVHLFDYSPEIKGNGYRSILQIVQKCCLHLLQLVRYICSMRGSMLFRKKFYAQELEAYVSALGQLRAVLYYALKLLNYCQEGDLFTDSTVVHEEVAQSLMLEIEELNQECFYGRCIGFQFCSSMVRPLQALGIAMASYSEGYLETSSMMQVATSVFNSGKYILDPELRAEQIVKATRTSDIRFCKALWGLAETGLMLQLPDFVCPAVEVDELFPLGPDAFELPLDDGSDTVVITPPCAHTGPGHVYVRLISAQLREGQESIKKTNRSKSPPTVHPQTDGLVVHIHGGGFVAHSSKSHEVYLRDWAHVLNVPILSIDYSLSPEMPFPRALEECFYAYAWAVKNCEQLGSTGKSIVMVGDSAGGNLAIATAMRAASFGIRRPDGLVSIYACTMVSYTPSPARLLSLMDPLLSFGLLSRCLAAYAGVDEGHPLDTPQHKEFQSEASLSTIRMQSVEATDREWIIVAQNQQECLDIKEKMAASSPVDADPQKEKSVIDSLEDSFHEDEDQPDADKKKLSRSDTVDSEEVEIFSQLANAGTYVFSKEGKNSKSGGGGGAEREATSPQSQNATTKFGTTKKTGGDNSQDARGGMTLEGIQETAKNVVAGAQSVFTSLTSYIPKRSKQSGSSHTGGDSAEVTNGGGHHHKVTTPDIDCFVDLSYTSDPVDGSFALDETVLPSSMVMNSMAVQVGNSSSSSQMITELTSESQAMEGETEPSSLSLGVLHVDRGMPEWDDGDKARISLSAFIGEPSTSDTIAPAEMMERPGPSTVAATSPVREEPERESSEVGAGSNPTSSMEEESRTFSLTSDSSMFKSALESPFLPEVARGQGHVTTPLCYLNSPCIPEDGNSVRPPVAKISTRPAVGLSPNSETPRVKKPHPPPAFSPSIPSTSSSHPPPSSTRNHSPHCTENWSCPSPNLPAGVLPPNHRVDDANAPLLSPNNPPSFIQEDFACDENSLCFMQSLPQENKELLEDAIQAGEFWGRDGESESSDAALMTCHSKKSPVPSAARNDGKNVNDFNKKNHDNKGLSGENNDAFKSSPCLTTDSHLSSAAKPPSDLKLAKTTTSNFYPSEPAAAAADSGLPSDPMEAERDDFDFTKSCLEFLTPSSPVDNDSPARGSTEVDGLFRSESAPALPSFLSPSPMTGASSSFSDHRRSNLNGLKAGMSPSDFKRRTFTTQSPLNTMRKATVVKNPYMSPLLATEELIKGLPHVAIVACHLDPLMDDSIMFAKRLKAYDMPMELHLVDDLPHGFLNFSLISNEAKKASRLCADKILDLLEKPFC